jgi:hypothetical protein
MAFQTAALQKAFADIRTAVMAFVAWSQRRMRDNRSNAEIRQYTERLQYLIQEKQLEIQLSFASEVRTLELQAEIAVLKAQLGANAEQRFAAIQALDAWRREQEARHPTMKDDLRRIYEAKKRAIYRGEL